MSGWAASEDATRIHYPSDINVGYLFCWLNSHYGPLLVKRFIYGSDILHIDFDLLCSVIVPNGPPAVCEEIGELVLRANALRDEAWRKEQKSIENLERLSAE
jgi:type I restriction enzyme, S subunit